MATIQSNVGLSHQTSGLSLSGGAQRTSVENGFNGVVVDVGSTDTTVSLGSVVTPQQIFVKNLSGSDIRVGLDGSTYPFRLHLGEPVVFPLEVELLKETSTVTTTADSNGSLGGLYFDLTDRAGTVRCWNYIAGIKEVCTINTISVTSINGAYIDLTDDVGTVRVWIDVDNTGTPPSTPGGGRLVEVDVAASPTTTTVATALQSVLNADSKFDATRSGTTVTVTAASNGTRTDATTTFTSNFTVTTTVQGVNDATAPSTPGGGRLLQTTLTRNGTATANATALAASLQADAEFVASANSTLVTITDQHTGTRTDISAGTSGWSVATTQQGAASPVIHLKSVGSSQAIVGVAPQ